MVPSGETPTAKSIAPPALFLRIQAPRNFAQSPAPTGLLLFRCLVSNGYSITKTPHISKMACFPRFFVRDSQPDASTTNLLSPHACKADIAPSTD